MASVYYTEICKQLEGCYKLESITPEKVADLEDVATHVRYYIPLTSEEYAYILEDTTKVQLLEHMFLKMAISALWTISVGLRLHWSPTRACQPWNCNKWWKIGGRPIQRFRRQLQPRLKTWKLIRQSSIGQLLDFMSRSSTTRLSRVYGTNRL